MIFNVVTVILAAAAVLVSVYSVLRQSGLTRTGKDLDFTIRTLIENMREKDYQNDQRYVLDDLACAYDPSHGIDSLVKEAREAAFHVILMYETRRGAPYLPFFENVYREVIETDPVTIYAKLKLRKASGEFWRADE